MRNYEGVFEAVNGLNVRLRAVLYFSATGESKKLAKQLAARLGWVCFDLFKLYGDVKRLEFGQVAVVFPVYSQGVPGFLKPILRQLTAEYAAIIATYGRMGAGNAVYEAARLTGAKICAAAYIPARHSYIENDDFEMPALPEELVEAILQPNEIALPKRRKVPFAGFLPDMRSRLAVKILRTEKCNGCGICGGVCPVNAINNGKINKRCMRCLKCVRACPQGALEVKYSRILKRYLKKKPTDEIILYT